MPITVFRTESGAKETWLVVNDESTVTYHSENAGWRMVRRGMEDRETTMSADEAKKRWLSYAQQIDEALNQIQAKGSN